MTATVLDKMAQLFFKFGGETSANLGIHPAEQAYITSGPSHRNELSDIAEPTPQRAKRDREMQEQEKKIALKPGVGDTMRGSEVKSNQKAQSALGQTFSRMGAQTPPKPPGAGQILQNMKGMVQQFDGAGSYVSGTMLPANFQPSLPTPALTEKLRPGTDIGSPAPTSGTLTGVQA